jgi:phosphoglycolate phosphatase
VRVGAVAFDLDGTLIDSRHDLAVAVNRMRGELGLPELAVDDVLGMIGEGARNLVRRALGGAPAEADLERALAIFYRRYDGECTRRTRAFPGIDELLATLASRLPLALVTNKPERFSRKIVAHLGWNGRFDPLIGGDTLPTRKPDPAGLLAVCARHGVRPAELVLVGDSRVDATAARAAGARFVWVEWGFAREPERAELARGESARTSDALARLLLD